MSTHLSWSTGPRVKNGDWQCLYEDYVRAAAVQRQHRASKPVGNPSEATLRLSSAL
jgi:hypothetical protein